jgi:glycosyltransferase involved in cell wall biosynthesis
MKLMIVGHPFLLAHNQKKYVAMKQLDPELRLRLVVPSRWRERFDPMDCQLHPGLTPKEVVPLKPWPSGWHMTYLHGPQPLAAILREFRPDVIHIEEDPQALITLETITLQRIFARHAAVTLFSWDNLLRSRRFPLSFLKRTLRAYSLRRVSAMICGNRRAAELLSDEGRFKGLVEVVPQYGLDVTEHQPGKESHMRAKLGLTGSVVVSYVGRLVPEKGLRLLIDALDRLQSLPWKLLLVGAGSLEDEIRRAGMAKFPGRIVLVPAVPYERVPEYLRCSDIFVLPSHSTPHWTEQFGLSLTQAMMLGIASIGSSSGAIPEVLGPGGLVFQEGNTEALTQALEELVRSPARREQLGALGRQWALQNYSAESIGVRYLSVFERAQSRRGPMKKHPNSVQLESDLPQSFSPREARVDRRI